MFGLVMSVYFLCITFANSGINLATTRLVSEELAINSDSGAKIAIKKCLLLSISFGITASVLLFTFAPIILETFC